MGSGLLISDLATGFGVLFSDLAGLSVIFGPTPPERIFVVGAESRLFTVPSEERTFAIPAEDRTFTA